MPSSSQRAVCTAKDARGRIRQLSGSTRHRMTFTVPSTVTSADPALPLRVVSSDGRLFTYVDTGGWSRAPMPGVLAATYAQ